METGCKSDDTRKDEVRIVKRQSPRMELPSPQIEGVATKHFAPTEPRGAIAIVQPASPQIQGVALNSVIPITTREVRSPVEDVSDEEQNEFRITVAQFVEERLRERNEAGESEENYLVQDLSSVDEFEEDESNEFDVAISGFPSDEVFVEAAEIAQIDDIEITEEYESDFDEEIVNCSTGDIDVVIALENTPKIWRLPPSIDQMIAEFETSGVVDEPNNDWDLVQIERNSAPQEVDVELAEIVLDQFEPSEEAPCTEGAFAAAEFDLLRGEAGEIVLAEEVDETGSSIDFGDAAIADGVEAYPDVQVQEAEIAAVLFEVEEFEVCQVEEAPCTESEFAAAEFDLSRGESGEIVLAEEVDETGSSIDFGEAAIADRVEAYSEVQVQEAEIAAVLFEVEEFEVCRIEEAPCTEGEFAAAEFDLLRGEAGEIVLAEEVDETGSSIDFGDAAIADRVEAYPEVQVQEAEIAAVLFEVEEFEVCRVEEAPCTESDFAAADEISHVNELPADQFKDLTGSVNPVELGGIVLLEGIEPYSELATPEARFELSDSIAKTEVEWASPELEICAADETPIIESELVAAYLSIFKVVTEPSVTEIPQAFADHSPIENACMIGELDVSEVVEELPIPQIEFAFRNREGETEWTGLELEVSASDEAPNTERELSGAESDVKKLESEVIHIAPYQEPKGAETSISLEDLALAERIKYLSEEPKVKFADSSFDAELQRIISLFGAKEFKPQESVELAPQEPKVDLLGKSFQVEASQVIAELDKGELGQAPHKNRALAAESSGPHRIEPYGEWVPEPTHEKQIGKEVDLVIPEFETAEGGEEAPNTEREFSDAKSIEKKIQAVIEDIEELTGDENPTNFGDVEIADTVAPYAEAAVPETRVEAAVVETPKDVDAPVAMEVLAILEEPEAYAVFKAELADRDFIGEILQIVAQFEYEEFGEEPDTTVEFAAAVCEVYTNNLKNREFDNEATQNQCLERATIADRQGASEDKDSEEKPRLSETDSSDCLCINSIEAPPLVRVYEDPKPAMPKEDPKKAEIKKKIFAVEEPKVDDDPIAFVLPPTAKKDEEPAAAPILEKQTEMPAWFSAWLASYQPAPPPAVEEYEAPCVPDDCKKFPWPKFLSIRHTWGEQEKDCIPFATNYTTAEVVFAPDYKLGKVMPFLDLRGHRFDNNTYAANGGIGGRYIPDPCCDCFCEILGFNAYYDFRQGCIGYYQQVGLGLEILGRRWDLRANAYAPFGRKRHMSRCVFDDYDGDYYAIRDSIESISYSFNAELGFLLFESPCYDFSLYAAAGPYFLARALCNDGVVGGEARIRPQYKDYLALDVSWRYDRLFETIWQVQIIINLPLYQISCSNKYPCGLSDRQIYQPIERFEVMPLSKRTCWFTNWE